MAGPVTGEIIKETLEYLNVEPEFTEKEMEEFNKKVVVPDVREKTIIEAGKTLTDLGFKYNTETIEITADSVVMDQFPLPGIEVSKGSIIDLYLNMKRDELNVNLMPDLMGKKKEEVIKILDGLNLKYNISGNGIVTKQLPNSGTELKEDIIIEVELSDIKE